MEVETSHFQLRFSRNCRKEIFEFDRNCVLGEGLSIVYSGTYTGKKVAIKRIELKSPLTEDEFQHHKELTHENVVELLAVFEDINFRYMVLELCFGTLLQVIQKPDNGPALPSDREVMYQIADGLNYVHSQNLVHFDVKPENILISMKGSMISLKLGDFGFCKETVEGICILSESVRGTKSWMAQEIFPKEGNITAVVSAKADVFSFGCVCFVFVSRQDGGIHPFGDWNTSYLRTQVQYNICEGKQVNIEKLKRHPYANFIRPMIEHNPKKRGSLTEFMTNLKVPTASSGIPSDMNTSTTHQAQQQHTLAHLHPAQEQANHASESHETMLNNEETTNQKVPNNCEVELTSLQSPRGSNGLLHNDQTEGDAAEADSDGSVKSTGEEPSQVVGNDLEQQAKPSPSALSGCNSSPSANGLVKPELKPKVVTKGDYEEQEEGVRKGSLNVSDEQETRDPRNLSTIKFNDTSKFETIKN